MFPDEVLGVIAILLDRFTAVHPEETKMGARGTAKKRRRRRVLDHYIRN